MNLYPHNQQAYDKAVEALKTSDRTCIIHPTGTGKSLIIAEFMINNPGKRHLVFAPSAHIRLEIMKHMIDYPEIKFDFATYHGLISSCKSVAIENAGYDFIYLDEFHRIGADKWGKRTMDVLDMNTGAKILGTSATHIRYLDDERNMADEIFVGNIASQMSLLAAIASGVLRPPTYISALYSLAEESKKAIKKIHESDHPDKNGLVEKLKNNIIDWEKSGGIDAIFSKHLKPYRNRIIVFCKNRHHMHQAKELLMPSFNNIWQKVQAIEVYSEFGSKVNDQALADFSKDSDCAKVLFTIDKLNEGLHVKGANTVIMMRDTTSPIIFYQQIGRCFSVGQTQDPLIFDLVNNFSSVRINEFKEDFGREQNGNDASAGGGGGSSDKRVSVKFIDETKHWNEVFQDVLKGVEPWEVMYEELKSAYDRYDNFIIPVTNRKLCNWASAQRQLRKKGILDKRRVDLLNSIKFNWGVDQEDWEYIYDIAKAFAQLNGHLKTTRKEKKLNRWLVKQRSLAKKSKLDQSKINKLTEIGFEFEIYDSLFNRRVHELKNFLSEHGKFPTGQENTTLYGWVKRNIFEYRKGLLSEYKLNILKGLIDFDKADPWIEIYNQLKLFYAENGVTRFLGSNKTLSVWVANQRSKFNELNPEKQKMLLDIGFKPNGKGENFGRLVEFKTNHKRYPKKHEDKVLYGWIVQQRLKMKQGVLSYDQIEKLNAINFKWEADKY